MRRTSGYPTGRIMISRVILVLAAVLLMATGLSILASGWSFGSDTIEKDVIAGRIYYWPLNDILAQEFPGDSVDDIFFHVSTDSGFFSTPPAVIEESGERYLECRIMSGLAAGTRANAILSMMTDDKTFELTVTMTVVQYIDAVVGIGGLGVDKTVYDGEPVSLTGAADVTLDGTPVVPESVVYTYEGRDGTQHPNTSAPTDAGSYRLTIQVSGEGYRGTAPPLDFEIDPRPLTITPTGVEILKGALLPDVYQYEFEGLAKEDDRALFHPLAEPERTNTDLPGEIRLSIVNAAELTHRNYTVTCVDSTITVRDTFTLTHDHYTAPELGEHGWYRNDVTVTAAGLDGFDEIALSAQGAFGPMVVLTQEGKGVEKVLYLRNNTQVEQVLFRYNLDKTSPELAVNATVFSVSNGSLLTVTASDALSGIADVVVTDPFGRTVAGYEGVYPINTEGSCLVVITDLAGNSAGTICRVSSETGWTESEGGLVFLDGTGNWDDGTSSKPQASSSRAAGAGAGTAASTAEESNHSAEAQYWGRVAEKLSAAKDGTGVSITPKLYQTVPADVLNALSGRDITLRIKTETGYILLYGRNLAGSWQGSFTLEELVALADRFSSNQTSRLEAQEMMAPSVAGEARPVQMPGAWAGPEVEEVPVTVDSSVRNNPSPTAGNAETELRAGTASMIQSDPLKVMAAVLLAASTLGGIAALFLMRPDPRPPEEK